MRNIIFFLATAFFIASHASYAVADTYKYKPYIGVDYAYNHTTAGSFNPYYNTVGFHVGSSYSRYFATELFFNQSNGNKRHKATYSLKTSYRSYGLDLLAFLPIGCSNKFSLLGTTGIGEYVYKTTFVPAKHYNEHGYGYRFGGGFTYTFTKNWNIRTIVRYVNFGRLSNYDHAFEYSAGVEYHF